MNNIAKVVVKCISHCKKNIFSFSKCSDKIVFLKKIALEYDLSCIIRKDDILFPENLILFFRQKRKDDLPPKNTWKYDSFFKYSEKMVFPKNRAGI